MENRTILGIIAIILGFLILIFPFASNFALSVVFGVAFFILGIYYLIASGNVWSISKGSTVAYIILGILSIICGYIVFFNVLVFDLFVSVYLYVFGFMIIIAGIMRLFHNGFNKGIAVLSIILGIITVFLGYFAMMGPVYVAIIIGVALIVDGFGVAIGEY
ncbi:MAG: DUF308 domain-containing protein [Methanobrevibacter sp.]|uniref:DUF308 domain-containing protein n=1 Tax=Methanobrevibacter sp. TaxID=66852 RepID=UPI0026DF7DFF|nr:DUF308 domain-containing protein [Methanobrevibacter sp.]MDO5848306.1 DUF308 domain-containing protein [Methanobrevibacter sp.]